LPAISMKELLEAGVHFGHQTKRWNSEDERIHLRRTQRHLHHRSAKDLEMFKDAARFVQEMAAQGKNVLFVGTKAPGAGGHSPEEAAALPDVFRQPSAGWVACSPNMATVQKSIKRLKELDATASPEAGGYAGRPKKEAIRLERERNAPGAESVGHQGHARFARRALRDRFEQGSDCGEGSAAARHSGGGLSWIPTAIPMKSIG